MIEEIKKAIADYLESHEWFNLGTVDTEGKAMVHPMGYVSDGATVYFGLCRNPYFDKKYNLDIPVKVMH